MITIDDEHLAKIMPTIIERFEEEMSSYTIAAEHRQHSGWTEIVMRKTSDKIEWCKQRECNYRSFGKYWFFEDAAIAAEFVMRWQQ
jgi:hypothetical protein